MTGALRPQGGGGGRQVRGPTAPSLGPVVARVLVVEDDPTVSGVLVGYLRRAGFEPVVAADGPTALQEWTRGRPDVVVLDVMLPASPGSSAAPPREADDRSAVIVLSARGEEEDRLLGLDLGRTTTSPSPTARARSSAASRRCCVAANGSVPGAAAACDGSSATGLWLDVGARTAGTARGPVTLTLREFDLLAHLMAHPGEAFTKEQLLRRVWGWDFGDTSTVTVHVRRLREKIEDDPSDPRPVVTLRGAGYRFDGEVGGDG